MGRAEKIGGYAEAFGNLDADGILANTTEDFRLVGPGDAVVTREEIPAYIASIRKVAFKMDLADVVITNEVVWCHWTAGSHVGAGRIYATDEGVTEERLYSA